MMKLLDSQWRANDRSGTWLKIKPDYVKQADIDAVVIGGYWGQGRRAGEISEYLLGLAETPRPGQAQPSVFLSFCR